MILRLDIPCIRFATLRGQGTYMATYQIQKAVMICICSCIPTLYAQRVGHFYHAHIPPNEPRLNFPWLAEYAVSVASSSSEHSYNLQGEKQPLFDIFGTHDPASWAEELSDLDPAHSRIDRLLSDISHEDVPPLSADGIFRYTQIDLRFTQNLDHGWFIHGNVPIREVSFPCVEISPICKGDHLSYKQLQERLSEVLNRLGIRDLARDTTGIGETTLTCGHTWSMTDTISIDYIDLTCQAGAIFPSLHEPQHDVAFEPVYEQHDQPGFLWVTSAELGCYDWLTWGGYASGSIFASAQRRMRIHTTAAGSGWLAPETACVDISGGHIWSVGYYVKADHVLQGLSSLLGYGYEHKSQMHARAYNQDADTQVTRQANRQLCGWSKHTLHAYISYDFANIDRPWAPEIVLFVHHVIDGRQVFESTLAGAQIGCNISFAY